MRVRSVLAAVLAVLGASCTIGKAHASPAFYVGASESRLVSHASHVVVMREGTRTVLSIQSDYDGPPEAFAMVVPVPSVLQKENVRTLPSELLARIDRLDAPRLVEAWEGDPCVVDPSRSASDGGSKTPASSPPPSPGFEAEAGTSDNGVTVQAQFGVGEYDAVILGAKESAALEVWLRREGYKVPVGSEVYFRPYVQAGIKFLVLRVDPAKVKREGGRAVLSPVRVHYDADTLALPLRIGLASSSGVQDVVLHVLGKGHRFEAANYPNVMISTNLDVAEDARGKLASFYAALFDRTLERTPTAVVTEYARDVRTCDSCPAPPLTDAELVSLGADVLPSVSSEAELIEAPLLDALGADAGQAAPSARAGERRRYYGLGSFVLTRLHLRYGANSLPEDVVLRDVPPIAGGRELRDAAGRLEDIVPAPANAFQSRYVVRHAWAGPIACPRPVRGVWGSAPGGVGNGPPRAAVETAYAARNVQLASFLRQNIPALGLVAAGPTPAGVGPTSPSPSASAGAAAAAPPARGCGKGCTTSASSSGLADVAAALGVLAVLRLRPWLGSRRRRSSSRF